MMKCFNHRLGPVSHLISKEAVFYSAVTCGEQIRGGAN